MFGWLDALARRPALLGAVLALLVGALTYGYVRDAQATAAPSAPDARIAALVARRDIVAGATIAAGDVDLRELAAADVLPDALRTSDAAVGRYAAEPIAAGQQIPASAISDIPAGSPLARAVPEDTRAISVAISEASAAGGLVAPGDRVDVVAVFDQQHAHYDGSALVVDDVEVLAVSANIVGADGGADTAAPGNTKAGANPKQLGATVTLAVSPLQAQRLAIADEFGTLHVMLRRPGDDGVSTTARLDLAAVTGAPAAAPATTATPATGAQ